MFGGGPMVVLKNDSKRESGRKVQLGNIAAARNVADVIRTCLGPQAMLKMLMDPMGGIVMTNDGNAILREITVEHPAAKSMIEIARAQDEEVGDGTTSVIILAGEMLSAAEPHLVQNIHPTVIIGAYRQVLDDIISTLKTSIGKTVDTSDDNEMIKIINSCLGTKMLGKWSELACSIALKAVRTVYVEEQGHKEADVKKYARIEKIPGGALEDSHVLDGVMFNKDVVNPNMRRKIENPRILLLDCNLEYKKGESMTDIEIMKEEDFTKILQLEEDFIQKQCSEIIAHKPDLLITEKGISDLAIHFLNKAGISAIRRLRKTDNNRVAKVTGATIVTRTDEIKEEDIGTECGLFEIKKLGDEYFTYLTKCKSPKACSIVLRGASKDVLNEMERNLHDAMYVTRNVILEPKLVPGGGCTEMALAKALAEKGAEITGVRQWPYKSAAKALEIIPRTLIQNCGANTIRTITALRSKHAEQGVGTTFGIDGVKGEIADMNELGIWDPLAVRIQVYKTAIETAILLMRIDDIVSGAKKQSDLDKEARAGSGQPQEQAEMGGGDN